MRRTLALVLGLGTLTGAAVPAIAQNAYAPAGAQFEARLDQELNTKHLHNGDTFTLTEHEGFFHKAPPALKGAKIEGHVENVSPAHPGHGATMNVILDDVVLADGTRTEIAAQITSMKEFVAHMHLLRDSAIIVGSAVTGHIVAKRTGMRHGGMMGAGAGFVLATSMKSDIVVKKGTIVHLKLTRPVSAPAG